MKLHEDLDSFEKILIDTEEQYGIRADILEKDYYVTLLLKELSTKQDTLKAFFKGGTALYKALNSIRRFSEDIDLTVSISDCSKTQGSKRLKAAARGYTSLERIEDEEISLRGSETSVFRYASIVSIDESDSLQRFERVKVEATSFTVSEPTENIQIAPALYEMNNHEIQTVLKDQFDVSPFGVETIKLERIFVDKVFATEFYFERENLFDVAKHIYDIVILLQNEKIKNLLTDKESFKTMVSYKRKEEVERLGGIEADKKICDFIYLEKIAKDSNFVKTFMEMQKIYVFKEEDILNLKVVSKAIESLKLILLKHNI